MKSKVDAAAWAFRKGTAVVVASGLVDNSIVDIMSGREMGTFFTNVPQPVAVPTNIGVRVLSLYSLLCSLLLGIVGVFGGR